TCESVFHDTTPLTSGSTCALKSAALGSPVAGTLASSAATGNAAASKVAPASNAKERFIASNPKESGCGVGRSESVIIRREESSAKPTLRRADPDARLQSDPSLDTRRSRAAR